MRLRPWSLRSGGVGLGVPWGPRSTYTRLVDSTLGHGLSSENVGLGVESGERSKRREQNTRKEWRGGCVISLSFVLARSSLFVKRSTNGQYKWMLGCPAPGTKGSLARPTGPGLLTYLIVYPKYPKMRRYTGTTSDMHRFLVEYDTYKIPYIRTPHRAPPPVTLTRPLRSIRFHRSSILCRNLKRKIQTETRKT